MVEKQLSATERLIRYNEEQIKFLRGMQNGLEFEKNSLYAIAYGYYIAFKEAWLSYHVDYSIPIKDSISLKGCISEEKAEKHNNKVLSRYLEKERR